MARTKKTNNTADVVEQEIDLRSVFDYEVPKPEEFNFGPEKSQIKVTTHPVISASNWVLMAREIADTILPDGATDLSNYTPELLSVARRYAVIKYFSDFKVPNGDAFWLLVNYTSLYDDIIDRIRFNDVRAIFEAADKLIAARLQRIGGNGDLSNIGQTIIGALNKLAEKFSSVDFNEFVSALSKLPNGEAVSTEALVDAILSTKPEPASDVLRDENGEAVTKQTQSAATRPRTRAKK